MKKKIRIAIVGTGKIAEIFHLPGWKKNKMTKIVSICDTDIKRLDFVSKKFKIKSKYLNLKEMLKNETIDILSISTPPYLHFSQIKLAIKNNINVFSEKPFVIFNKDFNNIKKAIKHKKLACTCALHQRFRPVSINIKKLIEKKIIGEIYYVNIIKRQFRGIPDHSRYFSEKKFSGGGPLMDLGSHFLDLVFWFLNFPKVKKYSNKNFNNITSINENKKYLPFNKFDSEELSVGEIICKNNCLVRYEIGYALNQNDNFTNIELFGTKGSIKFPSGKLTLTKNNKNILKSIKTVGKKASIHQIEDFVKNYKKNKICVKMSEIGYITNLIEKLYKSS